jgi:hypothetical protein
MKIFHAEQETVCILESCIDYYYYYYYYYYYWLFSMLQLLFVVIFSLLLNTLSVKLSVTTVNAHIDARLSAEQHFLSVYI